MMIPIDLTAPNKAQSHSFFSVSTVLFGRAVPVRVNSSNPASSSMNLGSGMSLPKASIASLAAYTCLVAILEEFEGYSLE